MGQEIAVRLKQIIGKPLVKAGVMLTALIGGWGSWSDQLGVPTIGETTRVVGSLLPLWAWVDIGLLLLILGLLGYITILAPKAVPVRPTREPPQRPPPPDMTLKEVAIRLYERGMNSVQSVNREIADKVMLLDLAVWARLGDHAIERLTRHQLESSTFDIQRDCVQDASGWSSVEYNSVQFVRTEVDNAWPPIA